MSNKTELEANNVDLASILSTIQSLPVYKPPGQNVWKKYVLKNIIKFSVSYDSQTTEYTADYGATWNSFISSSYNTDNIFTIDSVSGYVRHDNKDLLINTYYTVSPTDLIIADATYRQTVEANLK